MTQNEEEEEEEKDGIYFYREREDPEISGPTAWNGYHLLNRASERLIKKRVGEMEEAAKNST